MNFSNESGLVGKYVRIAARYQEDGTLVATRIWTSSQFNSVWLSPEGHVLHVNAANDVIWVADESGFPRCHDGRCQHGVLFPRAAKSRRRTRHRSAPGPAFLCEQESGARLQSA